nr:iron-containing redox enzyme family protein [Myxococcus sp. RHSTA-1-4]
MQEAVRHLEPAVHDDPLAPPLIEYLREHIPQEMGHDEWALEALEALGVSRAEVWGRPPPPSVAALVGSQYYWIFHYHPVALLGYIKVVESSPTSIQYIEQLAARAGLPLAAFRLHLGHARLDPLHQRELAQLLDALPLTADQEALMGLNAARTLHCVSQGIDEVITLFECTARVPPVLL